VPTYSVKFTGHLNVDAESKDEALENFYANILEIFQESDITDVTVSEKPAA